MSSFPDVLSATLTYQASGQSNNTTFTVPTEYAFAVVQVCLIPDYFTNNSFVVSTSHGAFGFDGSSHVTQAGELKDFPILNLIIKGGEAFSLLDHKLPAGDDNAGTTKAKVTALCHKKPT